MPAGEPCRRRVDETLERHPLTVAAPARPEPQAAPGQRGPSTSWVALHLAAATERDSGRKARLRQRPPWCCGSAVSPVAVILGWVLVGVLAINIRSPVGSSIKPQSKIAMHVAQLDLSRPAAPGSAGPVEVDHTVEGEAYFLFTRPRHAAGRRLA